MTKKLLLFLFIILLAACAKDQKTPLAPYASTEKINPQEINDIVIASLKKTNRFYWNDVSDQVVWSALSHADSILSIGYAPAGFEGIGKKMAQIDISTKEWKSAKEKVLQTIAEVQSSTKGRTISIEEIDFYQDNTLPYIQIRTASLEVITALRAMDEVRYADPMGYNGQNQTATLRSGSGCGNQPLSSLPAADQRSYGTNGILPWNYDEMNMTQAWNNSNKGDNITIGLIDTGVSDDQDNLGSRFATGQSTGRTIEKRSTYVTCSGWWWWRRCTNDGPNDQCGHGTNMAGLIAAPFGTATNSTMGTAYRANLISYRATGDVVIGDSEEKQGVTDALTQLGNRHDVKIISMSIGDIFHSGQVEDAVQYAYGRGKLIFAAAGTSLTWTNWYGVIFPAYLPEAVAVTGITDRNSYEECANCHKGREVEFSVVMQRYFDSDRTSLTLSTDFNSPTNYPEYVGGSSCATAMMAGTAALVWSDHSSWSRSQVLSKLRQSSDLYPNRSSSYGYGTVDANLAVQ